ncbi:hypothetical protein H4R20_004812 [Coemansia guatemalensis]|uniref:Uncharacterized protein n=1 Tax=Coemansia guatemalensis TaxID=2761395 RepID=A0A9W8HXZ4_9FUNG|nr:hypothetical protein H4R20_004812 [Coemansia guatemalensis]
MVTCMAHTGFPGISHDINPFQLTFGFSAQDIWGLVHKFVDEQWRYRHNCNDVPKFKKGLYVGCLCHFEGYRIGNMRYIFNPHAILSFLSNIQNVTSPDNVCYEGHNYWIATRSMRILECIHAGSIYDFRRFYMHLRIMFIQRSGYQANMGDIAVLEAAISVDDIMIDAVCSQEQLYLSTEYDERTGMVLADICFKQNSSFSSALVAIEREPLDVPVIIWLLYQAGYLMPIAPGRVGIQNNEVLAYALYERGGGRRRN